MPDKQPVISPQEKQCSRCLNFFPNTREFFYKKQGRCKACSVITATAWNINHPERRKIIVKKYDHSHRQEAKERSKIYPSTQLEYKRKTLKSWRTNNPEKYKATYTLWRQKNHTQWIATNMAVAARRRAEMAGSTINDFTASQWVALQIAFDHRCAYCGIRAKAHLTQDHITPLSKGGSHTLSNIVPACQSCNSKKHTGVPLRPVQPLLVLAGSPVARVARLEYQRVQELS